MLTVPFKSVPIIGVHDPDFNSFLKTVRTRTYTFNMADVRDHALILTHRDRFRLLSTWFLVLLGGPLFAFLCLGIIAAAVLPFLSKSPMYDPSPSSPSWLEIVGGGLSVVLIILISLAVGVRLAYALAGHFAIEFSLRGKAHSDRGTIPGKMALYCVRANKWEAFRKSKYLS